MLSKQILVSFRVTAWAQTSLHFILQKHWAATNMTNMTPAALLWNLQHTLLMINNIHTSMTRSTYTSNMVIIWVIFHLISRISNAQRKHYDQNWVHGISLWLKKKQKNSPLRETEETWRKCKLLGRLLDTEEDVKRRKVLAINLVNSMKEIVFGDISIEVKVYSFIWYVSSVFLYNLEPWTLTKTLENTIDSFQRRLLRIAVLNVKWVNIATNDTVYAVTRQIPWSQVITRRELSWFGHLTIWSSTATVHNTTWICNMNASTIWTRMRRQFHRLRL